MQTSRFLISDTLNKSKAVICQQLLTRPIVPIVIISPCFHFFPSMLPPSLCCTFPYPPLFSSVCLKPQIGLGVYIEGSIFPFCGKNSAED